MILQLVYKIVSP